MSTKKGVQFSTRSSNRSVGWICTLENTLADVPVSSSAPSAPPPTSGSSSVSTPQNHATYNNSTDSNTRGGTSTISTSNYISGSYESSLDDETIYGRLVGWNNDNSQSVPFVYSRVPAYTVRAAHNIDAFEKAFEKDADK